MKRFICVTLMVLCLFRLNAQDKENVGAQLDGYLDVKRPDSILVKQINPEDMFRKKITEIDSSSFDARKIKKQLVASYSDFRKWRIGVNGGAELIIAPESANISEELSKYKKTLKSGARFGADITLFISPNIGVGVNYTTYSANNEASHISYEINGNQYEGSRRDDIRIHFVGPTISIRSIPKHNKCYAFCDFIIGYFTYSNNLTLNNDTRHFKKENFGFSTSVGADYMFLKSVSMGVSLNIMAASIKNAEILSGNKVENLSRISLVITLKTYR
jgi:hypothetical protein